MSKKLLGFLIPIVGIALVLKYLYRNKKKYTHIEKDKVNDVKEGKKTVETIVRKGRGKLNDRQENILKLFKKRNILLPTDIYAIAPSLSTRTLRRDMTKLVELGFVVQEGNTKDTRYILKT
jgi:predicted HTH transcriptional regulator